jgi:hypothetical protein
MNFNWNLELKDEQVGIGKVLIYKAIVKERKLKAIITYSSNDKNNIKVLLFLEEIKSSIKSSYFKLIYEDISELIRIKDNKSSNLLLNILVQTFLVDSIPRFNSILSSDCIIY